MTKEHFTIVIADNVEKCRTEAEISDEAENGIGIVYKDENGWHTELFEGNRSRQTDEFDAAVNEAKHVLSR